MGTFAKLLSNCLKKEKEVILIFYDVESRRRDDKLGWEFIKFNVMSILNLKISSFEEE
jgi:DNA-directed RNA polymerase subunit L